MLAPHGRPQLEVEGAPVDREGGRLRREAGQTHIHARPS
jgi:hypothetical protein